MHSQWVTMPLECFMTTHRIISVAHQQSQNITDVGELLKFVMEKLCCESDPRLCSFCLSTSQTVCCLSITINYYVKSYPTVCLIRYSIGIFIRSSVLYAVYAFTFLSYRLMFCDAKLFVRVLFYFDFDVLFHPSIQYYRSTKLQGFRYGSEVDVGSLNRYRLFTKSYTKLM